MVQLRVEARDLGSIPSIGGHFRSGCSVQFILSRSSWNRTKNSRGLLHVCTPHMQSYGLPF